MSFEEYFKDAPIQYFTDGLKISEFLSYKFREYDEYIVIWYGDLFKEKNPQKSTRKVKVFFLSKSNMDVQLEAYIPTEFQVKMPIGTIIKQGYIYAKYNLYDYSLEMNSESLIYINNREEYYSQDKSPAYAFEPRLYPVERTFKDKENELYLERDSNTLIVFKRNNTKFVIHPLLYFNAFYGVSKKINSILLCYTWGDNESSVKCVHNLLGLNKKLEQNPQAAYLSSGFRKKDVHFLYHLRNNADALAITQNLNRRVLGYFAHRNSSPLQVKPYHKGVDDVKIKGIQLSSTATEQIVLCTEIVEVKFSAGPRLEYFEQHTFSKKTKDDVQISSPVRAFDSDEITVANDDNASNTTTKFITSRIEINCDDIEIVKIDTQADEVESSKTILEVQEPVPSRFSVGLRTGFGGDVGTIRSYIDSDSESTDSSHHYSKLLENAVELKNKKGSYFYDMTINCVTLKGAYGEEIITITPAEDSYRNSLIDSIFVLRLKIQGNIFYLIDTDSYHLRQGLGILVRDESYFKSSVFVSLIQELFFNDGRLLPHTFASFGNNISVFKHVTKSVHSNWVKTIVNKLT